MKIDLVSGGCGFVGKNMVQRLIKINERAIIIIDDLSVGNHPDKWISLPKTQETETLTIYGGGQVYFIQADFLDILKGLRTQNNFFSTAYNINVEKFADIYHFAAIVGGRAKIDGDPMAVALDLAIDAEFFKWVCDIQPERVLYPSSSAAYPINLQTENEAVALTESDIDFSQIGQPDMTYGWSKLTGEFLAKIAAEHYGVHVTCIRPFSGYGEDQDLTYPISAIARRAALKEDPFEVWGTGKQGRDFVHIDDVIDCIILAMKKIGNGSAINIGQGKLTSFLEIIELFTEFADYEPTIKQLLDKPVGVHARYANMDFVNNTLGWQPKISIREGMRRVYERQLRLVNGPNPQ